jgi:LemA protein
MDIKIAIGSGISILIFLYAVVLFNSLITLKNNVKKGWANIDVLLKQRNTELPKLVTTCKQYMQYEHSVLQEITELRQLTIEARNNNDIQSLGMAEGKLRGALNQLFAVAEDYPDLKANEAFLHLQTRISSLENAIADRRELYNEYVTLNNTRIEQFPDLVIGKLFRFKHFTPLEFTEDEIKSVNLNQLFKE